MALLRSLTPSAHGSSQVHSVVIRTLCRRKAVYRIVLRGLQYKGAALTSFREQAAPPAGEKEKFM